jgi:hypothetical protein
MVVGRFVRACPVCGYRFVAVVSESRGRLGNIVSSVLCDHTGRREVVQCPGCGRPSNVFSTSGLFQEKRKKVGSKNVLRREPVRYLG